MGLILGELSSQCSRKRKDRDRVHHQKSGQDAEGRGFSQLSLKRPLNRVRNILEKVRALSGDPLFSHGELTIQGEVSLVHEGFGQVRDIRSGSRVADDEHLAARDLLRGGSRHRSIEFGSQRISFDETHATCAVIAGNGTSFAGLHRFSGF